MDLNLSVSLAGTCADTHVFHFAECMVNDFFQSVASRNKLPVGVLVLEILVGVVLLNCNLERKLCTRRNTFNGARMRCCATRPWRNAV